MTKLLLMFLMASGVWYGPKGNSYPFRWTYEIKAGTLPPDRCGTVIQTNASVFDVYVHDDKIGTFSAIDKAKTEVEQKCDRWQF